MYSTKLHNYVYKYYIIHILRCSSRGKEENDQTQSVSQYRIVLLSTRGRRLRNSALVII